MSNKTYTNPWAGLSSYQDPESADEQLKFCGRDNESFDVAQLIDDNIFVTLYGKSGTGKTSLLNAGVFPRLRQEQYLPVSIRLGMEAFDISFQQCILTKISQALQDKGTQTTVEVVPMPVDELSTEYLWSYFARTRFMADDGSTLFPVLVFDQFEEVFRNRREEAETLLRQIHFMMDENHALSDRMVDGQPYQYDFNFRFVVSIREDDLYRLEDSIDNCYLPELKRCRYRLRSLSEQGASDVILIPGEGLFKTEEQKDIVDKIVGKSRNEDGSISTNIISLLCSRIYADFQRSGADYISPYLVDSFLKGNPFEQFYNEATRGFSNREKSYIESHLVDSVGRRNSVPESDFMIHIKNGAILLEGKSHILQRASTSSDGKNYRIELIHDSFCKPLAVQKEKRMQRRRIRITILAIVTIVCIIGSSWLFIDNIKSAQDKAKENEILNVVRKSQMYLDQGDSYSARISLLDILPNSSEDCSPIIESMLRTASANNSAILTGHTNAISQIRYNKDNSLILSASYDGTAKLWDIKNGKCIKTFPKQEFYVYDLDFFKDESRIITLLLDCTIIVWDVKTAKELHRDDGVTGGFYFSPDKNYIILVKENAELCNPETLETIKVFDNSSNWDNILWAPDGENLFVYTKENEIIKVNIKTNQTQLLTKCPNEASMLDFSIDSKGEKIAGAFGRESSKDNGFIKIWDANNGTELLELKDKNYWVNGVCFSPNGKIIASTSMGADVRLWSATDGTCLSILKGHSFTSGMPQFSNDGNFLITGSADFTIRIWEINKIHKDINYIKSYKTQTACFNEKGNKLCLLTQDTTLVYDVYSNSIVQHLPSVKYRFIGARYNHDVINALAYGNDTLMILNSKDSIWKKETRRLKLTNAAVNKSLSQIAFLSKDSVLLLYDINKNRIIKRFGKQHKCEIIRFSPDGKLLATSSADSVVKIWDVDRLNLKNTINTHKIRDILISHDNRYLLSIELNKVHVWDIKTSDYIKSFEGHIAAVYSCDLSSDDKYLVTSSHECLLKVWDFSTGTCLQTVNGSQFTRVLFSPSSDKVCVLGRGKENGIFNFTSLQQIIDEIRQRFGT